MLISGQNKEVWNISKYHWSGWIIVDIGNICFLIIYSFLSLQNTVS